MEQFGALTAFYEAIADDARVNTAHISVYMALLQHWNLNQSENPITINRGSIMKMAKINARHTYNKCINGLNEYGYIKYIPAGDAYSHSSVYLNLVQ